MIYRAACLGDAGDSAAEPYMPMSKTIAGETATLVSDPCRRSKDQGGIGLLSLHILFLYLA